MPGSSISYREGTQQDSPAVFRVFAAALRDLGRRRNVTALSVDDPAAIQRIWPEREPLFRHLAATAQAFWVAEQGDEIVGYARLVERDGLTLMTEFFVAPELHGRGIGRELFARTFPQADNRDRVLLSTLEEAAMVRYLAAGLQGFFPIKYFSRRPLPEQISGPLTITPMEQDTDAVAAVEAVDRQVIGHSRRVDHEWLRAERRGFVYRLEQRAVGYGYVGRRAGPFALTVDDGWQQALQHAENVAAQETERIGFEIPLINRGALNFVLDRSYEMSSFTSVFMADRVFGRFEDYIVTDPSILL